MKRSARGFTFIELLVAVAISGVLFAGGLAAYRGVGEKQVVKQAGVSFQSKLRLAQQKALAGEKPSPSCDAFVFEGYSVSYVDSDSYKIAVTCGGGSSDRETVNLAEGVTFTANFGTIFFPVLRNELTGAQIITLTDGTFSYQVEVESSGVIKGEML